MGRRDEAKRLFKAVYVDAGPRSREARAELAAGDISAEDLLDRGTNLIRKTRYNEAEKTLRAALGRNERELTREIIEHLALSLFRQKKYGEAAGYFQDVGDLYNAARSFMRSGREEEFKRSMEALAEARDPKGARLMIAYAGELRRRGKADEAVELLEKVRKVYSHSTEEALWHTGWIHYRSGDFGKARKTFARLYARHKDPKYLYWQARASEKTGGNPRELYEKLDADGFYGFLALLRTDGMGPWPEAPAPGSRGSGRMEKIDLLVDAGLRSYAVRELISRAESNRDTESLREVALRLMDLHEYRRAILVTSTLPEETRPLEILYPLAFWPKVSSSAADYGLDPYLLLSLIREESRFDPRALSQAGAVGLMQLMPQTASTTARKLRIRLAGPRSLRDADLNISLGTYYLSILLKQFEAVPAALAAYNAGGSRVAAWLSENDYEAYDEFIEDIPFGETRNYVKRIVSSYYRYRLTRPPAGGAEVKIL
jgi:soluble lytic murein transglycosylase